MKVKFSRCTSSNLANVPQVDGQLIYTKDTNEVYLDVNNNRNKISDVIMVANKSTIVTPVTSKLYYETSTDTLYKAKIVENDNEEEIVWIDITGATVQYVDTNFLKKDNTTAYTPVDDYNPATKKYVDDNCIPYQPFPAGLDTSHTTLDFITSIRALNLPAGSTYLGGVTLTDMPFNGNAEVEIYVYPNNVIYLTLRSANISPYMWECNSHTYRGWEAVGKAYADSNFLKKDNTVAYTPTGDYNPTTKKYVDDVTTEIEGTVEELIDNQISNPTSGANIDLQDSANSEVKSIDIFGNSEQETRSGKNRIKLIAGGSDARNGITAIVNNDLSITLNGTATEDTNINFSRLGATIDNNVISGNTLSVFFVSGTWTTSNPTKSAFRIYNSDFSLALIVNQLNTLNNNNKVRYSTYQNNDLQVSNWNTNFLIPEGDTLDNFTVKLMLTDEVDTEYEDYGAMPSPDYPSEIKSTGDNGYIVEKFVNKNLFDKENIDSFNTYIGTVSHAISTNINEKFRTIYVKLINGKTYTVSKSAGGSLILGTTAEVPTLGMELNNFSNYSNLTDGKYGTITLTGNDKYLVAYIYSSVDYDRGLDIQEIYNSLQIEEGSVATDYEPHQLQTYTIPCQQPMRAIGNVKDTFVKVDGVWYERHYINRLILRESQEWKKSNNTTFDRFYLDLEDALVYYTQESNRAYCNYFSYSSLMSNKNEFYLGRSSDVSRLFINFTDYGNTSLQDFKDFLEEKFTQGKPVYADYALKEPLDLPCTQEQIEALESLQEAKTYKTMTHIYSEDEVPAEVDLIYYLDNETAYKNILTNYVKKTDYAKGDVGGLIKTGNGFSATSNGYLTTSSYTYPEYITKANAIFIGKGTLETIISSSILKTGSTAPTTSTVGYRVGQLYLNTTDNKVYQLVSIDNTDPNNIIYNWQQIINNADLANTVGQINTVLDSINGVEV